MASFHGRVVEPFGCVVWDSTRLAFILPIGTALGKILVFAMIFAMSSATHACPDVPKLPLHAGFKEYVAKIDAVLKNNNLYKKSTNKRKIEHCYYEKVIEKANTYSGKQKMFFLFSAYFYFYLNYDPKKEKDFYRKYFSTSLFVLEHWDVFLGERLRHVRDWVITVWVLNNCDYLQLRKNSCKHINKMTKEQYLGVLNLYLKTNYCRKQKNETLFDLDIYNIANFFLSESKVPLSWKRTFLKTCSKYCVKRENHVTLDDCFK